MLTLSGLAKQSAFLSVFLFMSGIQALSQQEALLLQKGCVTDVDKLERVQKRATKLIPELAKKTI